MIVGLKECEVLLWVYWIVGVVIYSVKFLFPSFNRLTAYGKLQDQSIRSRLSFLELPHSMVFTSFYISGLVFVVVLLFCPNVLSAGMSAVLSLLSLYASSNCLAVIDLQVESLRNLE
mgnify:CR=1 FL=1